MSDMGVSVSWCDGACIVLGGRSYLMALGIFLIAWAIWFAFKSGFCLTEEIKVIPVYWGVASIICATFGVLVLGGVI